MAAAIDFWVPKSIALATAIDFSLLESIAVATTIDYRVPKIDFVLLEPTANDLRVLK